MSAIIAELQKLTPSAIIELFEILLPSGEVIRFHAGTNGLMKDVVWSGNTFNAIPAEASGFELTGGGQLPRPKLAVANIQGVVSDMLRTGDPVGCKVTRIRTLARFLDAVNFPNGNPDADPTSELPRDIFYIDRISSETKAVVEFELASSLDLNGVQIPRRQIIQNNCCWRYRSAECGYTGPPVAKSNDQITVIPIEDVCGKRLQSCKMRWGDDAVLPFGGFPAAGLVRT